MVITIDFFNSSEILRLLYFFHKRMPTIRNKPVKKVLPKGRTAAKKNAAKQAVTYRKNLKKKQGK
jgi:hypothetical protein